MIDELSRLWWLFSIRGLLSLTFAYICYLLSSSMATLVLRPAGFISMQVIFSFYIIASGFVTLTGGLYAYDAGLQHRRPFLISGLCGIGIGVASFATLALSMRLIDSLFGLHAFLVGLFYLITALRMRAERTAALVLGVAGACSLVAGILFILERNAEMVRVTSGIAVYSLLFGLLIIALSLILRASHPRRALSSS